MAGPHTLCDKFTFAIVKNSVSRGLGAAAGGSHGTYLCIKQVMKDRGLHVAKLSRFKSGPNISV